MSLDRVVCSLCLVDGRADLKIHVLPWTFRMRVLGAVAEHWPSTGDWFTDTMTHLIADRVVLDTCRDAAGGLDLLAGGMRRYAALRRGPAGVGTPLPPVPHPLVAQDVSARYATAVLAFLDDPRDRATALAAAAGRASLPDRCGRCGTREPWTLSCSRPECREAKVRRVTSDVPVAWCWRCYAQPPAPAPAQPSAG